MSYVVRKEFVARSLARLREQKTHTLFTGYLYLQYRATQLGRTDDLQPTFLPFFKRFFQVENHPLGSPYIKIFTELQASDKNLWLNENVAGSYAPSSLRLGQPFRKVVQIEDRKYSLPFDHAERALQFLLYSKPVQVVDLAIVLYRDYAMLDVNATANDLVRTFAYEFGYSKTIHGSVDENFNTLFSVQIPRDWNDWLEPNE